LGEILFEKVTVAQLVSWFLTSREEHRLRVFENRVLRRIFGHNEELHALYSSSRIVRVIKARRMRWAGHVAHGGDEGYIQHFGWDA
jgi:hypothetical protein